MRIFGVLLLVVSLVGLGSMALLGIVAHNRYRTEILGHWDLADRSSTLQAKAEHIDAFLQDLDTHRADFADWSNPWLHPPQNNTDRNIEALKSLRNRLNDALQMDQESFAYQLAIQQITGQEQGEANALMSALSGAWWLHEYPLLWDLWCALFITFWMILFVTGACFAGGQ